MNANLFVVLHALLEERSVARAGKRLGLSPSATSHALSRARDVLGDPLLVRAGRQLVLTPRALALQTTLARAIAELETALAAPAKIDAATLRRAFRIETTDHVQFVLLRALDPLVRKRAPHVDFFFQPLQPETFARLREGAIDLAIGVYAELDPDIERERLFDDRLVAVVRKGHPALRGKVTLERFAGLEHLLVAPNGTPVGLVDRVLAERRLQRRVLRTSTTFLDMAFLVAQSDYVVSLPHQMVAPLLSKLRLAILPVPLPLPSFTISMIWHRRATPDHAHAWFRGAIHDAVRTAPG